jgi:hypothetical protein
MLALLAAMSLYTARAFAANDLTPPTPVTQFTDIAESPHKAAIEYCYHYGFIKGKSATIFAPDESLTREQLVTIWSRTFHVRTAPHTFTDVPPVNGNETDLAIILMYGMRHFNGKIDTFFGRKSAATRAETAYAIVQTYLPGVIVADPSGIPADELPPVGLEYADADTMDRHTQKVVKACVDANLFEGVFAEQGGDNFAPTTALTRGELCRIFYNLFSTNAEYPVPETPTLTLPEAIKSVGENGLVEADGIVWRVLDIAQDGDYALIITNNVVDTSAWDSAPDPNVGPYVGSTLYDTVNGFYGGLNEVREYALKPLVSAFDSAGLTGLTDPLALAGADTDGIAFPLSTLDATTYFDGEDDRVAKNGEQQNTEWWLRTANTGESLYADIVATDGDIVTSYCTDLYGVRPAVFVALEAVETPEEAEEPPVDAPTFAYPAPRLSAVG